MRRAAALVVIPLIAAAAVAGCGSAGSTSAASAADTNASVTVTGTFGKEPKVKIPAQRGTGPLYTKTLIEGSGTKLTSADSLLGNFVMYDWSGKTHKLIGSTFSTGTPTLFSGPLLPGLEKALLGQKIGSRVLAVIPPKDAFGSAGNSQIGIKGTDTVVFVVDLVKTFGNAAEVPGRQTYSGGGALPAVAPGAAGKGPTITVPSSAPPKTLQVKTLIKGTGPKAAKGSFLIVQYTGVNWRTKKVFDSSWARSAPFAVQIGAGQVIKGWDTGLLGQTAGSRVLLVIPPADGYGKAGSPQAGIKGTDTLVFVVDILGIA